MKGLMSERRKRFKNPQTAAGARPVWTEVVQLQQYVEGGEMRRGEIDKCAVNGNIIGRLLYNTQQGGSLRTQQAE
eukprot:scaffold9295_cov75-Skeletonema_dohrnii-CCMP3373.AAC.2